MRNANNIINNSEKGFTLLEILAVIIVIGILTGLAVVKINSSSEAAKNTQIKSLMSQTIALIGRYRMGGGATPESSQQVLNLLVSIRAVYGSLLVNPNDVSVISPSSGLYYVKAPLIRNGALSSFWCMNTEGYEGGTCP